MNRPLPLLLLLLAGQAGPGRSDVALTVTQVPAGTLHPGDSFALELSWSGDTPVGAADYTVNLGTGEIAFTNRSFAAVLDLADTVPAAPPTVSTNAIFTTWFDAAGFLGQDARLEFQVPAGYAGPGTVPVTLAVASAQDTLAQTIAHSVTGATLNIALPRVITTYQAGDGKLTASDYADAQLNQTALSAGVVVGGGVVTPISVKEDTVGTDNRIGLFGFFNLVGAGPDQIPEGATIVSATLTLRCTDGGRIQDIYVVDRPWTETTATWNNFFSNNPNPGPAEFGTLLLSQGPFLANSNCVFTITSAVQQWADNPAGNFGLLFESNGGGGGAASDPVAYVSGESATITQRPLLTVEYRTNATPTPFATWMTGFGGLNPAQRLPEADPDADGAANLVEFALMGSPTNAAARGVWHAYHDEGSDALALVAAVRRGATFGIATNNGQVAMIDGVAYLVSGASALPVFTNGVRHAGFSDTPPAGSGQPGLSGRDWQYHTFHLAPAPRGHLRLDVRQEP